MLCRDEGWRAGRRAEEALCAVTDLFDSLFIIVVVRPCSSSCVVLKLFGRAARFSDDFSVGSQLPFCRRFFFVVCFNIIMTSEDSYPSRTLSNGAI